jgi:NAD(P)H-dependent FMN reductase
MNHSTKILAFSGSVRKESLNQKFLEEMVKAVRTAGGDVTLITLRDYPLPLYDGDLEEAEGLPANARKLIDLIKGHAGLLIASPEYNSMNTPLLKNTLDWCTRDDDNNPFPGRVAAVISASPGALGGIRSLKLAQQLLLHLGCQVVPGNVMLPHAHKAFGTDGKLTDARSLKALNELAAALVRTAQKLGQ